MKLFFQCKNPSLSSQLIDPVLIEIEGSPTTVSDLIKLTVEKIVEAYNRKPKHDMENRGCPANPLEENEIRNLATAGKIAFGLIYNDRVVDPAQAVETANNGYKDGLFKIFHNNILLGEPGSALEINDGDLLTLVRLTFLSGRII